MKVLMLYRPNSEFARSAEEYVREFERVTGKKIEKIDIDSREGIAKAKLYDILDHPSFVAIADDGQYLNSWVGQPFPLIDELSAYTSGNIR